MMPYNLLVSIFVKSSENELITKENIVVHTPSNFVIKQALRFSTLATKLFSSFFIAKLF